jgi:hypothetical protein
MASVAWKPPTGFPTDNGALSEASLAWDIRVELYFAHGGGKPPHSTMIVHEALRLLGCGFLRSSAASAAGTGYRDDI